jgi:hypothetical protein
MTDPTKFNKIILSQRTEVTESPSLDKVIVTGPRLKEVSFDETKSDSKDTEVIRAHEHF